MELIWDGPLGPLVHVPSLTITDPTSPQAACAHPTIGQRGRERGTNETKTVPNDTLTACPSPRPAQWSARHTATPTSGPKRAPEYIARAISVLDAPTKRAKDPSHASRMAVAFAGVMPGIVASMSVLTSLRTAFFSRRAIVLRRLRGLLGLILCLLQDFAARPMVTIEPHVLQTSLMDAVECCRDS